METLIFTTSQLIMPAEARETLLFFKNLEDYPQFAPYSRHLKILKTNQHGLLKEMTVTLPGGESYYAKSVVRFFKNGFRIRQISGQIKNLSWQLRVKELNDFSCCVTSTHRFDKSNLKNKPQLEKMIKQIEEELLNKAYEYFSQNQNEIVVTGLGLVTNRGVGKNAMAEVLERGTDQIQTLFKGYVSNFDPIQFMPMKYVGRTDRSNQLALAAVKEALSQSKIEHFEPEQFGIVVCNYLCGVNFVEKQSRILSEEGPHNISKYLSLAFFPCGTAGMISLLYQIKGYSSTLGGIENPGMQALQIAEQALKNNKAKYVLVGATDAPLIDLFLKGYTQKYGKDSAKYLSEAACFLILEKKSTAQKRKAPILITLKDLKKTSETPIFNILRFLLCGDALSVNDFIEYALKIMNAQKYFDGSSELSHFSASMQKAFKEKLTEKKYVKS